MGVQTYAVAIDRQQFQVAQAVITGRELRALSYPAISEAYDLWLGVPGHEDRLVGDEDSIDISAYGQSGPTASCRLWTAPKIINAGSVRAETERDTT